MHMEDVLEVYRRPYDPRFPVVCMDEQPTQLIKETRVALPPEPGKLQRIDFEYERNGTATNFLFTEPLACWRKVSVRQSKKRIDWAEEIRDLLETDYPDAEKVILVCDNLNTHSLSSLYEAFPPELARRLVERVDIHHTPKHGSWLNIAEIELSVLTRQCLDRRIAEIEELQSEAIAWYVARNENQRSVDWQFTTTDARTKLKRLYPQIQMS